MFNSLKRIVLILLLGSSISYLGCQGYLSPKTPVPSDHQDHVSYTYHKAGLRSPLSIDPSSINDSTPNGKSYCGTSACHGNDLRGGKILNSNGSFQIVESCYQCHDDIWNRRKN